MILRLLAVFIFGALFGLGINYLCDILPLTRQFGRPVCIHCQQNMGWGNYLTYQACKNCTRKRNFRSWLVQLIAPVLSVFLWLDPPLRMGYWIAFALLIYLSLVAIMDLEYRVILHPISVVGGIIGFLIGWKLHGIPVTLLGGLAGFAIMLVLYLLGGVFVRFLSEVRKQEIEEVPLGFGDVNLSAVLGLLLGWPGITLGLLLAILLGGLISAGYILGALLFKKYQMFTAIPYAPFLIIGTIVLLFR